MVLMSKYTDQGGRRENEDSFGVFTKGITVCAAVADGLGSYGGGKTASSKAVEVVEQYYMEAQDISPDMIKACISDINREIYMMQTQECRMMTTLAVLYLVGTHCIWAHVGDTRIYHFIDNRIDNITLDHSVPQQAVEAGEITQADIRHHKDRNKLLRALGQKNDVKIDISDYEDVSSGNHAFLLCTDGFWEYVEENDMEETLKDSKNPVEWMKKMTGLLQQRVDGKNDNNTAVAVWIKNN
jgi:serine/threonine protein phosphatase PrpC